MKQCYNNIMDGWMDVWIYKCTDQISVRKCKVSVNKQTYVDTQPENLIWVL